MNIIPTIKNEHYTCARCKKELQLYEIEKIQYGNFLLYVCSTCKKDIIELHTLSI